MNHGSSFLTSTFVTVRVTACLSPLFRRAASTRPTSSPTLTLSLSSAK